MTELPFDVSFFDAAYASKSLVHMVEIYQAVGETRRVVKSRRTDRDPQG